MIHQSRAASAGRSQDLGPRQVYEAFRDQILAGVYERGSQLPSSGELANELGVSGTTVTVAYDQLGRGRFHRGHSRRKDSRLRRRSSIAGPAARCQNGSAHCSSAATATELRDRDHRCSGAASLSCVQAVKYYRTHGEIAFACCHVLGYRPPRRCPRWHSLPAHRLYRKRSSGCE
ncbi:GntR family transcriptional regulator [Mesorhizobium japonicum]|nr:GntR family transcriptional regulator [Mesorhizobium japonicum]